MHFHLLDYAQVLKRVLTERQVSDKGYALIVEDNDLDFFPKNRNLLNDCQYYSLFHFIALTI